VRDSQVGSVCERVVRRAAKDVLVVKQLPEKNGDSPRDTILVGIDGSPQSFGALLTAIELAKRFDKKVEAIAVYDPYLHYTVFNGIVNVLTEKAAKVFRFEEAEPAPRGGDRHRPRADLPVAPRRRRDHGGRGRGEDPEDAARRQGLPRRC